MAYPFNVSAETWWDNFQADPKAHFEYITSKWGRNVIVSCQYFVSGLPAVCSYWDGNRCVYSSDNGIIPSGFGDGTCDKLGRRSRCSMYYAPEEEDAESWYCTAISPDWGAVFIDDIDASGKHYLRIVKKSEVETYCEEEGGIGRCDGWGCGRQCGEADLDVLLKKPIKCSYYRPWMLGFGAIEPQLYNRAIKDYTTVYNTSYEAFLKNPLTGKRLPYVFEVFNYRALTQPCAYWNGYPALFKYFSMDGMPDWIAFSGEEGGTCTQNASYSKTKDIDIPQSLVRECWSEEDTIVCNGARPECPYYTGQWLYCTDERMLIGMPITALQILELRFWYKDWNSQEEYDNFWSERPNWDDASSPDIYTFTKWERQDVMDTSKSIMLGKKFSMCQPAPIWSKQFDVATYITIEDITYPPLGVNIGTEGPAQRQYPTLIRKLKQRVIGDLVVVYPYLSKDKKEDKDPCEPRYEDSTNSFCEKRASELDGDFISTVGCANGAVIVYAINATLAMFPPGTAFYNDTDEMPADIKKTFFEFMDDNIDEWLIKYKDYIVYTAPGSQGVFVTPPFLPLEYNEINFILIIAYYQHTEASKWAFKKRKVFSKFYGGIVVQNSHEFAHIHTQYTPDAILPPATVTYITQNIGSAVLSRVLQLLTQFEPYSNIGPDRFTSTYSLERFTTENDANYYTRIGSSSYVWIELEDLNIGYVLWWTVVSAIATITITDVNTGTEIREVSLSPVFPVGEFTSNIYNDAKAEIINDKRSGIAPSKERLSIPPNAYVLLVSDPGTMFGFSSKVDKIKVTYRYLKICTGEEINTGDVMLWPNPNIWHRFVSGGGNLSPTLYLSKYTASLMGFFADEDGRDIVAFATRMYANVNRVICRNVEIFYKYNGSGVDYLLSPYSGFADHISGRVWYGQKETEQLCYCGDHLMSAHGIGPMWFPYNSCSFKRYQGFDQAGYCMLPYEKLGPYLRTGGPEQFDAYCTPGSTGLTCHVPWSYHYIETNSWEFSGHANIVSCVDTAYYSYMHWRLPPFGNLGRDFVERYMAKEYSVYTNVEGDNKGMWCPSVIDSSTFHFSFNSFAGGEYTTDCFVHVDQMNFFLYNNAGEKIVGGSGGRKRWDEVFEYDGINGYYPPPVYYRGSTPYVYFYYFKSDSYQWAWQEYWLDIERDTSGDAFITAVQLIKPGYFYAFYKEEHRFILDEGEHKLYFTAPVFDTKSGEMTKYPSLSIDGFNNRYFNIDYGELPPGEMVEWMDDTVEGKVGTSGGRGIYFNTMELPWVHSDNLLYDSDAVKTTTEAEAKKRMYILADYETKRFYNRGVVCLLSKSSLPYLPIDVVEEIVCEAEAPDQHQILPDGSVAYISLGSNNIITIPIFGDAESEASVYISKIVIEGRWGKYNNIISSSFPLSTYYYIKPEISMSCINAVDVTHDFDYIEAELPTDSTSYGLERSTVIDYTITRKYTAYPQKLMDDRVKILTMTINKSIGSIVCIKSITIYVSEYVDRVETIKVWERKYIVSEGGHGTNFFGTKHNLVGIGDTMGPFFDFSHDPDGASELSATNKTYSGYAHPIDIDLFDSKEIPCTKANLQQVEFDEQKKLYHDNAYAREADDNFSYTGIMPPILTTFITDILKDVNLQLTIPNLFVNSEKLKWENKFEVDGYAFPGFWLPGGHKFYWGGDYENMKCWMFSGGTRAIYNVRYQHVRHTDGQDSQEILTPIYSYYFGRFFYQYEVIRREYEGAENVTSDPLATAVSHGWEWYSKAYGGFGDRAVARWYTPSSYYNSKV